MGIWMSRSFSKHGASFFLRFFVRSESRLDGATALAASVTDPHQFRSGRQFAAWLGLTSEVEQWQRAARSYHQDGRQIPAQATRCRRDVACAPWKAKSRSRSTPGGSARKKTHQGGHCRAGEQDRAGHLGDHGTWRNISCRSPTGAGPHKTTIHGLAEEEISFTRLRARCDVMADRSDREQGQPKPCPRRHAYRSRMSAIRSLPG